MMKFSSGLSLLVMSVLVCSSAAAQNAPELTQSLSLGGYYADGKYGQSVDTEVRYVPLTYRVDYGNWGFQVLTSHLQIDGSGEVLVNLGGISRPNSAPGPNPDLRPIDGADSVSSSGLGDTLVSAIYRFDPVGKSALFVDLRVDVKLPTADEAKTLGTGEVDYTVQLDLSQSIVNSTLFASIGFTVRGDSEVFTDLENSAFAQFGFAFPINSRVSTGVFYDYREKAALSALEIHEVSPYLSFNFSDRWSLTGLLTWGLTDASADQAVLGQLSYRW